MKSIDGIIKNPTVLKPSPDVRITQKIRNVSQRVANETVLPVARLERGEHDDVSASH